MDPSTAATFDTPPRPPARIWFAILGAPALWTLQNIISWLITDFGCPNGGVLRIWLILTSLLALAGGLAALWIAVRAWTDSSDPAITQIHGRLRPDFLAATALFVSAVFVLGIIASLVPVLMLPVCGVGQ